MKKLILITIIMLSIFTAQASEIRAGAKRVTIYTYEQGLAISFDISSCLMGDEKIKTLVENMLNRFEKETRSRDFGIMLLVMRISRKYRIGMQGRYISDFYYGDYIKSVVSNCRKVAESEHRN